MKIRSLKSGFKINMNPSEYAALVLLVQRGQAGLEDPKTLRNWKEQWPSGVSRGFTSAKLLEADPLAVNVSANEAEAD